MLKKESPYTVVSVDRALELLILLAKFPRDIGVTELSKMLCVQKSTAHSLLQTLLQRGFVQQTESGKYTLGVRLMQLGAICSERLDVRTIARPIMFELAEQTRLITLLAVLSKDELVIIEKIEPQNAFLIIPKFDFSITLHSTAVGKVLLASAPEAVIRAILSRGLERYTPYTLTNSTTLLSELDKVRQHGYAIACNETIEGMTCIAAPIHNASGEIIAALSISSASSALPKERYLPMIQKITQKAQCISGKLGYPSR